MTNDDIQKKTMSGPDIQHPEWIFRDGKGLGCVRCMPVAAPTWGSRWANHSADEALVVIALVNLRELWWQKALHDRDDRWKVVVSRSNRRIPFFCRTVALEFCETLEEAKARQIALLRGWSTAGYADARPLSRRERRRLRLTTLR